MECTFHRPALPLRCMTMVQRMDDSEIFYSNFVNLILLETAEQSIQFPKMAPAEMEELSEAIGFFKHKFRALFDNCPQDDRQTLMLALKHAFIIGSRGSISKSARSFLKSVAGKTSGEKRREKSVKLWKEQAAETAKRLRAKNPTLSQDDLAKLICDKWDGVGEPSHRQLLRYIASLEKTGEIPRRNKP